MGQGASSLSNLQYKINYNFNNQSLLQEATTHDSLRVTDQNLKNYQRLEHLGDSVLQLVITDYLFRAHPKANEGELSKMRADLVDRRMQQKIANTLELQNHIKMAPGVAQFTRYDKFVEALIGAVYVDAGMQGRGFDEAKKVIYKLWELREPNSAGNPCIVM